MPCQFCRIRIGTHFFRNVKQRSASNTASCYPAPSPDWLANRQLRHSSRSQQPSRNTWTTTPPPDRPIDAVRSHQTGDGFAHLLLQRGPPANRLGIPPPLDRCMLAAQEFHKLPLNAINSLYLPARSSAPDATMAGENSCPNPVSQPGAESRSNARSIKIAAFGQL